VQMSEKTPRVLPLDTPEYHRRTASHLRALAAVTTTAALKARLLRKAEEHERQVGCSHPMAEQPFKE
jgi:hypothetical protein